MAKAKLMNPARYTIYICDFSRCRLNVRLCALTSNLCSEATNIDGVSCWVLFFCYPYKVRIYKLNRLIYHYHNSLIINPIRLYLTALLYFHLCSRSKGWLRACNRAFKLPRLKSQICFMYLRCSSVSSALLTRQIRNSMIKWM